VEYTQRELLGTLPQFFMFAFHLISRQLDIQEW
jgi:hypothetical protein